ncbi:MAG: histidine phosphatase family protein [Deltaproteobacteria bacterium]|nr:histidine phosphatase family protein [Deltaproteobacteria bacterium]
MKTLLVPVLIIWLASPGLSSSAAAEEAQVPVESLKRGGYLILFSHGETDRSLLPREQRKPEPSPMDLANCDIQAKLNEKGREDARVIGAAFKTLGIPVGVVLASGYCRTMETARIAFGRADASEVLLDPPYKPAPGAPVPPSFPQRMEALRRLLATSPPAGTNAILVTHSSILLNLLGSEAKAGEALIYKPNGQGGFSLVARVLPKGWSVQSAP